jgi:hypothetical protein
MRVLLGATFFQGPPLTPNPISHPHFLCLALPCLHLSGTTLSYWCPLMPTQFRSNDTVKRLTGTFSQHCLGR